MDQVVMAGKARRKKNFVEKKTKVTSADQNGNRLGAGRPAPSQEHIVNEP